ncbi:MAG: hypothetical protein A3J51_00410 [Omnitrophica WOR_2 bacterium RIFCSPHIGHO2_02_FULL_45_21]|nr:MAG: hypothetical protein A3J51_00410 [Omnitrophica WOR_2 bacterium RIFCSPHIGHO2_02_FULL_45_21]
MENRGFAPLESKGQLEKRKMLLTGFTLIELMVVIAIVGLLASVVTPQVGSLIDRGKVAKIVSAVAVLETAELAHYTDTSYFAREWDYTESPGSEYHALSMSQGGYAGWNGPYIPKPWNYNDNVVNQDTDIGALGRCQTLCWNHANFDLDRNGSEETTTGAFVGYSGIPSNLAQRVDSIFDGPGGAWSTQGKVEWDGNWLSIFLVKD